MPSRALGLATVVVAATMDLLDGTVVNTVLPRIRTELDAGAAATSWIATAYSVAFGVGLTVGGHAGDRFGHRRLLVVGTVGFALASLVCAVAPDPSTLIIARGAQGAAAAAVVPQTLALIQLLHPGAERARALAVFATVTGLATVSGPLLGAVLTETSGWRLAFLINLPLAAVVLAGAVTLPPASGRPGTGMDLLGIALVGAALAATLLPALAVPDGPPTGWQALSLVLGAGLFATFAALERRRSRARRPVLVEPVLLRTGGFLGALLVTAAVYAAVFGLFFTLALFLQSRLGWSPLHAASTVLPWTAGILVGNVVAARRLVPRHGRRVLVAGIVALTAGLGALAAVVAASGPALTTAAMAAPFLLAGLGMGLVVAPVLALGLAEVPPTLAGGASGLVTTVAQLAGALGIAVTAPIYFSGGGLPTILVTVVGLAALAGPASLLMPAGAVPRPGIDS